MQNQERYYAFPYPECRQLVFPCHSSLDALPPEGDRDRSEPSGERDRGPAVSQPPVPIDEHQARHPFGADGFGVLQTTFARTASAALPVKLADFGHAC